MRLPLRLASAVLLLAAAPAPVARVAQVPLGSRVAPLLRVDGLRFRDLDRDGRLGVYEDWRRPPAARAADLLRRMTLAEKLGQMLHGSAPQAGRDRYDLDAVRDLVLRRGITAMITRLEATPAAFATANNAVQAIAEQGRLGIPVLFSSDPRNQLAGSMGASIAAGGFTPFPDPLGMAAIDDAALTRQYADIIRREYRAVGLRMALSPQADLATEPRWPRIDGTFGEDPAVAARMVGAFVRGLQAGSGGAGADGVAAVVKHWVGYGAAGDRGFDSHNRYGRFSAVTDATLPLHVRPFLPAFAARVAGVMPMYSVPRALHDGRGRALPPVAAGYSRYLLTDLLRIRYRFGGVVLSDWKITDDCNAACRDGSPAGQAPDWANAATPWGVEALTPAQRFAAGVRAGIDQFGGTQDLASLTQAVREGGITVAQVDRAVLRILTQSFALGLFENPYADPNTAARIVGQPAFLAAGRAAQARSIVLLRDDARLLPLRRVRVYAPDLSPAAVAEAGLVTATDPARADVAILRMAAPHERLHPHYPAGAVQHEGALDYPDDDPALARLRRVAGLVPTIVVVRLDRPAILTRLRPHARMLAADFGAGDAGLLDALTGRTAMTGRLPFELPATMAAVAAQDPARPADSARPLYPLGYRAR
ncbi:glycoside hydrolase family 3 protein [Sphingomonas abaci]|uniref:beta-glucosidase n=1 Tax=Sphingomonas abaci TaxID=237611 RepID=A0A7W7F010_9SPHN|nr:glycoside hydrolase family 3 protein [Sphingomonas abaci]MBB4619786.1 beta-glucosidase [Sphingomonas abaci]